jgi:hypothetical protein
MEPCPIIVDISGDTNPTSGYGIVNNDYRMGTYEITNGQWDKFVNAYGTVTGSPSSAYGVSSSYAGIDVPINTTSAILKLYNYFVRLER